MNLENKVETGNNQDKTILFDLWGVALDQIKAGEVMVRAYRQYANENNIAQEDIEEIVAKYNGVLNSDPEALKEKGKDVNNLQEPAEDYIADHKDDFDFSNTFYDDFREVVKAAKEQGYTLAIFTTKDPAETFGEYLVEFDDIYDASDGKSVEEFKKIIKDQHSKGREVIGFVEDGKAVYNAKKSGIENVVYVDRDGALKQEDVEKEGITYTTELTIEDVTEDENQETQEYQNNEAEA